MPRITLALAGLAATIGMLAWACGTEPSRIVGLVLSGPATAFPGDVLTFTARTTAVDGTSQDVTTSARWAFSPATVVTVIQNGANGTARAVGPGTATVTVQAAGLERSVQVQVAAAKTYQVSGVVRDASGQPIRGSVVTLLTTTGLTLKTTQTDSLGAYSVTIGAGTYLVQATFAGATSPLATVAVSADTPNVDFTLTLGAGITDIAGAWTASFSAPAVCAGQLPPETLQRTFNVTITQYDPKVVFFRFVSLLPQPPQNAESFVTGTIVGTTVVWSMLSDVYYGVLDGGVLERLAPTRWLNIVGTVGGTVTGATISATLTGEFDVYDTPTPLDELPGTIVPTIACKGTSTITFQQANAVAAGRRR